MNVWPISSFGFKANTVVYDFVDNETPAERKTKEHLDAEFKKKIHNDKKGRTLIEWINERGLAVCYSRPYETVNVKGYRYDNGKVTKVDENIPIGSKQFLSGNISQFLENRPIKDVDDGVIQVDLTFRKDRMANTEKEIFTPTTRGYVGDYYGENDSVEFGDIKKVARRMWKTYNFCYGVMSAIGIGCIAGLCWLIPMTFKNDKTKTMQKADTVELVTKAHPQKLVKDTLQVIGKRI